MARTRGGAGTDGLLTVGGGRRVAALPDGVLASARERRDVRT